MLGRGLESLIPNNRTGGSQPSNNFHTQNIPPRVSPPPVPPAPQRMAPPPAPIPAPRPPEPKQYVEPPRREAPHANDRESIFQIEVDRIRSNPYQPRKFFNDEELEELAASIREFGILQPLVVTKITHEVDSGTSVEYQLIAGERRLMAARRAGLERVPAIIKGSTPKQTQLELALIENIQRSQLNSLESAKAYARLQDEFNLTQREIAVRVGKSREAVANTLRLLQLPPEVQEAISRGSISESQARTLLGITDPAAQRKAFERLLVEKVSVRALRTEMQKPKTVNPEVNYWEKKLEEFFGAPIDVEKKGSRGKITLHFYSDEEWKGILDKIIPQE